jgi:GDPmannose 4,6-dehydratase
MKTALITGITGQDGSYLSEFLLEKGYIVHGIKRRSSSFNTKRIDHLYQESQIKNRNFILHYGDLSDSLNITKLIAEIKPDEIYNLAAMSHVGVSFDLPEYTANIDALGTLRVLEAVRFLNLTKTRIYQASTSELYGKVQEIPQSESTPFYPRSPYGVAKLYAFWITKNYREAYGIYAVNGILFNHESPRRGETFVTRKITRGIVRLLKGFQENIILGNLDSKRDWGHAKDYVRGMWMTLQAEEPDDWVFSTGITTSIRDFVKLCFEYFEIEIGFKGKGINEIGFIKKCNNKTYKLKEGTSVIFVSEKYFRPSEVDLLIGDSSKARKLLKWKPEFDLNSLVRDMLEKDLKKVIN